MNVIYFFLVKSSCIVVWFLITSVSLDLYILDACWNLYTATCWLQNSLERKSCFSSRLLSKVSLIVKHSQVSLFIMKFCQAEQLS